MHNCYKSGWSKKFDFNLLKQQANWMQSYETYWYTFPKAQLLTDLEDRSWSITSRSKMQVNLKKWVSPQCVGSIFCALKGLWMDCCRFYGHTKLLFDQQTNFKPLAIWGNLIWCWVGKKSHEVQSDTLCDPINSTDPTKLATFNDYKH